MDIRHTIIISMLILNLSSTVKSSTDQSDSSDTPYTIPIKVVDPDGNPVVGAKIGTGLRISEDVDYSLALRSFEDVNNVSVLDILEEYDKYPLVATITHLSTPGRWWPLRSDVQGRAVLISNHRPKGFHVLHEATGMVGLVEVNSHGPIPSVTMTLEPSCHVFGRIKAALPYDTDAQMVEATARIQRPSQAIRNSPYMCFTSMRGNFEFLLPAGQYELEAEGRTSTDLKDLNNDYTHSERIKRTFTIEKKQRHLDLGVVTVPFSKLTLQDTLVEEGHMPVTAVEALAAACKEAAEQSKMIFIKPSCYPGCYECARYLFYHKLGAVREILNKYYVLVDIETNFRSDDVEVYRQFAEPSALSWVIISPDKKVIADAASCKGNREYPLSPECTAYYLSALKQATPKITQSELDVLSKQMQMAAIGWPEVRDHDH